MGKLLKRIKNNIKKKNPMAGWKTGKETEAVVLKPNEKGPEFVVGNPSPEPRTDVTREDMRYLLDKEAEREAKEKVEIEDKPVEGETFATGLSDHSIPNGDVEDAMKELADKCTIETEIVSPMENFKKLRTTSVMVTNAWHKADGCLSSSYANPPCSSYASRSPSPAHSSWGSRDSHGGGKDCC